MEHPQNGNFSTSDDAARRAKTEEPLPRLWPLGQLVADALADATDAHEARKTGQPRGPITALKTLDAEIGGCLPKDALTMILGNSGSGKTALAGQIAARCGYPAIYLTTEMAPVELLRRHTARETSTFLGRLKSGELTPAEVARLFAQTTQKLAHLSLLDGTGAYASPGYLQQLIEAAKESSEAKHAVLVVDSLHTWTRRAIKGPGSEYDALNYHLASLIGVAKQAKCSIIIICEQNRASIKEAKESGGGNINSGAGSRFIEYSADLILDLEAKKTEDGGGEKAVTLSIAKNRNGAPDKPIKLNFNGALQRFEEASK